MNDATIADRVVRVPVSSCEFIGQGGSRIGSAYRFNPSGALECVVTRPRDLVANTTATVRLTWISLRSALTQQWQVDAFPYNVNTALANANPSTGSSTTIGVNRPAITAISLSSTVVFGTDAELVRVRIAPVAPAGVPFPELALLGVVVDYTATR